MTREAVSAAKPAVRAQAKTEKVHGAASAAVLKGLVYGAAVLTFAVLLFLLGYILVTGIPHLKPSLFQWNYTSENVSMMPAILTTVETTALALLLAVPLGLFTAVYLNEYAKRGNKLVNVIRITTETLSGIPSIVYGLFGMLFFVTRLHWGYSLLAGAMSACFSLGLESGAAIQAAAVAAGVKELFALNPVILLVTLGGFATNAAYCIFCNVKNRTGRDYFSVPAGVWVNNVLFCALAGVLWYSQFFGLGMGKSFFAEAPLMLAFSWSILMSLNVLFSNLWGILLHEWRGVDRRTAAVLVTGLLILIFSTVYPQLVK